jgi:2-polyprenyl-6-hydroxyphenyl methylase/3-demethylubiquinone-9 3-methyltransferase
MADHETAARRSNTIDPEDVAKFSAMAAEWWDADGKFKPLHKLNPIRLAYIKERSCAHFGLSEKDPKALSDLLIADIGCGGGLLTEPMARLGATVTGVDASEKNIRTAATHAAEQGLAIDYQCASTDALVERGQTFDIVLNMEVVEHVADVKVFLEETARLIKPGGLLFMATLNKTARSFALAIVGAEYVLGWLPRGTHQYEKFIAPKDLTGFLEGNGLIVEDQSGVTYNPLFDKWSLSKDLGVNYMVAARRPR